VHGQLALVVTTPWRYTPEPGQAIPGSTATTAPGYTVLVRVLTLVDDPGGWRQLEVEKTSRDGPTVRAVSPRTSRRNHPCRSMSPGRPTPLRSPPNLTAVAVALPRRPLLPHRHRPPQRLVLFARGPHLTTSGQNARPLGSFPGSPPPDPADVRTARKSDVGRFQFLRSNAVTRSPAVVADGSSPRPTRSTSRTRHDRPHPAWSTSWTWESVPTQRADGWERRIHCGWLVVSRWSCLVGGWWRATVRASGGGDPGEYQSAASGRVRRCPPGWYGCAGADVCGSGNPPSYGLGLRPPVPTWASHQSAPPGRTDHRRSAGRR